MNSSERSTWQQGFSLIELLIAMLLGIILTLGATKIYTQNARDAREIEKAAILSENGRFALQILTKNLRHAGFFGSTNIADIVIDDSLTEVGGDCDNLAGVFNLDTAVYAEKAFSNNAMGCISDVLPNTHLLVIKHVLSNPLYDSNPEDEDASQDGIFSFPNSPDEKKVYLAGNRESGVLSLGNQIPIYPAGGEARVAWPYQSAIYYIRDLEIPTLSRKVLKWSDTGLSLENEDLIEGVENLAIKAGVDSDFDGSVDTFENIEVPPSNWDEVEALEIYLLLRSSYPDPNYEKKKSIRYQMGTLFLKVPTSTIEDYCYAVLSPSEIRNLIGGPGFE